ncbi:MAG: SdrD B-like domain-containing protein [Candidatus Kaistia colombiensis]|nr:MAG: SdrD B-like domain-containing protein [Kaistia sp.]
MPVISKVVASCLSKAVVAIVFSSLFAVSAAYAKVDGGWTLNIDNTGYNPIPAGGSLPYAIRIDNNDNAATPATTIAFTIPAKTVFVGVEGLLNCTPQPGGAELTAPLLVTCDVPELPPGSTHNAKVNVRPMAAGNVSLMAKIPDPGPVFTRMTTVELGADLSVAVQINPSTVQAGSNANFSATVTNEGPYPADGATLTIPLPTGLSPNVSLPFGCSYAAPDITCQVAGPIASGASLSFDFTSQVTTENASTITVAAGIATKGPRDPNPTNNEDTTDIVILPGTDVSLGKTRAPQGLILVGDTVTFTLQPRHAGAAPTQATIVDTLPANYAFVSVTAGGGWTCASGQTVSCGYIAASGSNYGNPITITARAISATPEGSGVTNVATISSPSENADAGANNAGNDGAAFIAEPTVDLVALKSGPPRGLVVVGNVYDFSLSTRNDGNSGFFGRLTITDHLPAGLTVTAISAPAGWTCPTGPIVGAADVVCTTDQYTEASPLGAAQRTGAITLTTTVTEPGTISNGMSATFDGYQDDDAQPGNNTTSFDVESADGPNWADIRVIKTLNPVPAKIFAGEPLTFDIEIVNAGPATATHVVLDDRLNDIVAGADGGVPGPDDVGIDFVAGLATGMSCQTPTSSGYSRDLQCLLPSLPVCVAGSGDCPVVSVTVRPGSQGSKSNTAVAFSTKVPDNNTGNNTSSVGYTVDPRTDVTVSKLSPSSAAGAAAGQELIYVLTASVPRNGLSHAENVTLTDTLPIGLRFLDAVPSSGSCTTAPPAGTITAAGAQKLVCNLGTVNNGAQQTVTVRVVPTTPLTNTSIRNEVLVSTTTAETDPDNNDANLSIAILPPELDLIVTKTDGPDPVLIGTDTQYIVTVRNSGPSEATNVRIVDTLPAAGLADPRVVTAPSGGTCTLNGTSATTPGGSVTCDIPHLAAGSTISFPIAMRAVARGRHTNNISVNSDETELGYEKPTDNNASYEDTTVRVLSDLLVTKVPSVDTVDLRQEFSWTITVTNKAADGIDVAEWVTLEDTMPDGMELTALPVPSAGTCTGAIGQRTISCELGDIEPGQSVTILLTSKITKISAQSASNSATASTLSFDKDPTNNTGTGSVNTVLGSTISGTLYRDFDNSGTQQAVDTGIASVTMNLVGVALHDGAAITRSVTTDAQGDYSFGELPPGTYSVYYGPISESHLIDGRAVPGTGAGTAVASGVGRIDGIVTTNTVSGIDHDFTRVPVPRIGLGKVAGAVVVLADGSYTIPYTLTVKNFSLEPMTGISVTDILDGASQNFGTNSGGSVPTEGQYRVNSVSGNFGSLNAGFDGATSTGIVTGGTLAAGATGTLSYTVQVNPAIPRVVPALVHTNQAQVIGNGQHSGQTATDLSHNNSNPDPDGNGIPNEDGNNTPTTVTPAASPAITLVKTATYRAVGSMPAVGELVTYSFTVTNTGKTPLLNVKVTDPKVGLIGLPDVVIPRLNPGQSDSTTFSATYALTQADIDNGSTANTASVTGQWGVNGGAPVNVTDTDSATVPTLNMPGLTLVKTLESTTVANPTVVGSTVRYRFTVTNTGNTTLRNVAVADALAGIVPDPAGAFTIGTLAPGGTATVFANYAVTLANINAGKVDNSATASGVHGPGNTAITTPPSTVSVPLFRNPDLSLTKTRIGTIPAVPRAGDILSWTVTARNTGNVTLTNLVVSDPFPGATVAPAKVASLAPGATVDFTVTAPLAQDDINAGQVTNQAKVDFDSPAGPETPKNSNVVITELPAQTPKIALTKVGDVSGLSSPPRPGETIAYKIVIRNTGNVPLDTITLVDLLPGVVVDAADAAALATVVLQPQNAAGNATGTEIVVHATYPLLREDIDAGSVVNTAVTTGTSTVDPDQTVTDQGGTTFETDDPTTTELSRAPQIRLVKTITSAALSTPPAPGDVITYAFAVHNTGNVTLNNIVLTEQVTGVTVKNPSGWAGPLEAGDVNTDAFTATYALTQADIDRGSFANTALVSGAGPGAGGVPETVTDTSGTDVTNDTPTDQTIEIVSSLTIVKSHTAVLSTPPTPGDVITYSFLVTNTGNVTLRDVAVSDPLADLVMPVKTIETLLPGAEHAVTLTATYEVKQSDIQTGEVRNTASVEGVYKHPVTGTETAVPPVDSNEIVVPLDRVPAIALVKTAVSGLTEPAVVGQTITYTFEVTNTGNLDLTNVVIVDPLPGITPSSFNVGDLPAGSPSQSFTATYKITVDDINAAQVENQATVTANYTDGPTTRPLEDLSGPTKETDEPVIVPIVPPAPSLEIVKTGAFEDTDGSGAPTVGDLLIFRFTVTNTGNIPLDAVIPLDAGPTFNGLPAGAKLSAMSPAALTLAPNGEATFTATYPMTQDDIDNAAGMVAGVTNTALAQGYRNDGIGSTNLVESGPGEAVVELPAVPPSDISLTKQAGLRTIHIGEKVPYTITVTNNSVAKIRGLTVTDVIPSGFRFVDGTATIDGVAVTPVVGGRNIAFENLTLSGGGKAVIRLQLLALSSAGPGKHVNTAMATDEDGVKVAPDAKATVEILADPVFDCGEIIGKVFDDKNRNGYQDEGEPGLPGVRVATVRGVLITTDAHGRFHVACADLPDKRIGSNFIMKLDTRTLPSSYSLTTENPRVVRLTAGKMTKLNFGAAIGRVVKLDLQDKAFVAGTPKLRPEWGKGLDQLVELLGKEPSILRIRYLGTAEGKALADARMRALEKEIARRWRAAGHRQSLDVETRVEASK